MEEPEASAILHLLKTEQAKTIQDVAALLGRHRVTVQEWLRLYRSGGLETLLAHTPRTGRRQSIPQWAQEALNKQLHESQGSNSYGEICQWLEHQLGITAPYKTVPNHYRLVNLADLVPLLPPIQSPGGTYVHTGEEWSFLSQAGDFLPNHVVDTYELAIKRQVETNQPRPYSVSG